MDELTLTLPRKIEAEYRAAAERDGTPYERHPAFDVLDAMVEEHGREGRQRRRRVLRLRRGRQAHRLWPGPARARSERRRRDLPVRPDRADAVRRGARDRQVLRRGRDETFEDANIGSIFGIGFPAWTGGRGAVHRPVPGRHHRLRGPLQGARRPLRRPVRAAGVEPGRQGRGRASRCGAWPSTPGATTTSPRR
jgi:hypothetical protein